MLGATLRGERHFDGNVLLVVGHGIQVDVVDQAEVNDVDGNFRIVALAQGISNIVFS